MPFSGRPSSPSRSRLPLPAQTSSPDLLHLPLQQSRSRNSVLSHHSATSLDEYYRTRQTCPHGHSASSPCDHGSWSPKPGRKGRRDYWDSDEEPYSDSVITEEDEAEMEAETAGHRERGPSGERRHDRTRVGENFDGNLAEERRDAAHRLLGDAIAEGVLGVGVDKRNTRGNASRRVSRDLGRYNGTGARGGGADSDNDGKGSPGPREATSAASTTQWLARRHGIKGRRKMYLAYYIPFFTWITQYRWSYFQGDLVAALTMASFYIPMSLSYAVNLGHIPPINGLYSFVFNPAIYALLGTCPQMVVGPEAAGSLLVGNVVKTCVDKVGKENDEINSQIAGVVTGIAGAIIFIAGLTRLGFLESVLSRPFLRGFISAIGFVILVDQLIPETGLSELAEHLNVAHGSSVTKLQFFFQHIRQAHAASTAVAFGSFAIIMICRQVKRYLQPRYPKVAYIPDRFIVVLLSAVFSWKFNWAGYGIGIVGDLDSSGAPFPFRFPLIPSHMTHIREAMGTSFLISLLGFFESCVAAKSLGTGDRKQGQGLEDMSLSANRELVALGVANIVGGCFMALPAFGGYGRSKVNKSTGGKTPMSSILLSLITLFCVYFLLPYFYYIPKVILSSMISVVAYSLIEEAPHDIMFFVAIRGWSELTLMAIIFCATIFYSLPLGIALGVGLSLLQVIRHATKPRIQILGKVPGTQEEFENAEESTHGVEFIEGCLIVKIPEPLTFANTGDLKNRLRRLELYGTTAAHPALPRVRSPELNKNIIFDVHGVTSIDGSGTQVLREIVESYRSRGERVFFCRVPRINSPVYQKFIKSGIVERTGGHHHFMRSVDEALRMAEQESTLEAFRDLPNDP